MLTRRRVLFFNLRFLLTWLVSAVAVILIQNLAQSSERTARYWKVPAFDLVFVIVFALTFAFISRKFRPRLGWSERTILALATTSTMAVLLFCVLPLAFDAFLLWGSLAYRDPSVPLAQIPEGATRVDLSCTVLLDGFQGSRREVLERYLSSSAAWQVTDEDERRVARRRRLHSGVWQTDFNMYFSEPDHNDSGPNASYRTRIFLDGAAQTPSLLRDDHVEVRVGLPHFDVPLVTSQYGVGRYHSSVWIRGADMAIDLEEGSDTMPRDRTRATVSEICSELERLNSRPREIDAIAVDGSIAPLESFSIEDDGQKGIYQAAGHVNPGQRGFVYVKAFDKRSEARLSEEETQKSREYTGWSSIPGRYYYFGVQFTIYEGDWTRTYPARFELWFHPDDGTAERKLMTTERAINGWER